MKVFKIILILLLVNIANSVFADRDTYNVNGSNTVNNAKAINQRQTNVNLGHKFNIGKIVGFDKSNNTHIYGDVTQSSIGNGNVGTTWNNYNSNSTQNDGNSK